MTFGIFFRNKEKNNVLSVKCNNKIDLILTVTETKLLVYNFEAKLLYSKNENVSSVCWNRKSYDLAVITKEGYLKIIDVERRCVKSCKHLQIIQRQSFIYWDDDVIYCYCDTGIQVLFYSSDYLTCLYRVETFSNGESVDGIYETGFKTSSGFWLVQTQIFKKKELMELSRKQSLIEQVVEVNLKKLREKYLEYFRASFEELKSVLRRDEILVMDQQKMQLEKLIENFYQFMLKGLDELVKLVQETRKALVEIELFDLYYQVDDFFIQVRRQFDAVKEFQKFIHRKECDLIKAFEIFEYLEDDGNLFSVFDIEPFKKRFKSAVDSGYFSVGICPLLKFNIRGGVSCWYLDEQSEIKILSLNPDNNSGILFQLPSVGEVQEIELLYQESFVDKILDFRYYGDDSIMVLYECSSKVYCSVIELNSNSMSHKKQLNCDTNNSFCISNNENTTTKALETEKIVWDCCFSRRVGIFSLNKTVTVYDLGETEEE